jgi:hypothetical protein
MKERQILFSGQMVRAILEGRKTITRRVMKPTESTESYLFNNKAFDRYKFTHMWYDMEDRYCAYFETGPTEDSEYGYAQSFVCPYGQPGDRLWVRETFRTDAYADGRPEYRATPTCEDKVEEYDLPSRWHPSIYMPHAFSRILLDVTVVRVERVQDISEEDAKAEGVGNIIFQGLTRRDLFASLWDSINAKRGYGWDANPWVWVVEFKRVK